MNFKKFTEQIRKQFNKMKKHDLFVVDISKDDMWVKYLAAFPPGTNPIRKERAEYDCQCCRQFIRNVGNVIAIIDGKPVSIWDVETQDHYQVVADKLNELVTSTDIKSVFLHEEATVGTTKNLQQLEDGKVMEWNHFSCELPADCVTPNVASQRGAADQTVAVFKRGMEEITLESIEIVMDLIEQNSVYRLAEFRDGVENFLQLKREYDELFTDRWKNIFCWANWKTKGARIRNTAVGTLLQALSEGVDINIAASAFETMMAGYKRTCAPITKGMVEKCVKRIDELGLEDDLHRRFATIEDVSINNVIFADRSASPLMKDSLLNTLMTEVKSPAKSYAKVEEVEIEDFIKNILPSVETMEILLDGKHTSNLMSLVAPQIPTPNKLFQWDNAFSWSYNGNVADGIKQRVKQAGGNIEGILRVSLSWYNTDDLDIHVVEPDRNHIHFGNKSGKLDVDMNAGGRRSREPVENITWRTKADIKKGKHKVYVNNYSAREMIDVGFVVEIEFNGQVRTFTYDKKVKSKENVQVVEFTFDGQNISFGETKLTSALPSQDIWGVKTQEFQKVSTLMLSPNYWDEQKKGNKHYFFMLDGCVNPDETRGVYNEFLRGDLTEDRKVFEMLGDKMKCPKTDAQLSGLGFSSTKRDEIVCKVTGSFTRELKIKF